MARLSIDKFPNLTGVCDPCQEPRWSSAHRRSAFVRKAITLRVFRILEVCRFHESEAWQGNVAFRTRQIRLLPVKRISLYFAASHVYFLDFISSVAGKQSIEIV
jgi:hypothetical protein